MAVLENVDMHEQRFAGAGGGPEREFVQIVRNVGPDLVALSFAGVERSKMGIEVGQELPGVPEIAVQVDFGEKQTKVLEIFPADRVFSAGADGLGVANNVLVVGQQDITGELLALEKAIGDVRVEAGNIVLVQPFKAGVMQAFRERNE
ncbi:MAG: hypothetical protein ABSA47_05840 [Verrucomicrobiota bacterium]